MNDKNNIAPHLSDDQAIAIANKMGDLFEGEAVDFVRAIFYYIGAEYPSPMVGTIINKFISALKTSTDAAFATLPKEALAAGSDCYLSAIKPILI